MSIKLKLDGVKYKLKIVPDTIPYSGEGMCEGCVFARRCNQPEFDRDVARSIREQTGVSCYVGRCTFRVKEIL